MKTFPKYKEFINEGYFKSVYQQLDDPIIPDAVELMKQMKDAVEFKDKKKFEKFLDTQRYFSASYSHCYYSIADLKASNKGEKTRCEDCVMLFETGHLIVAVWDSKNNIGYILPTEFTDKYTF